MYTEQEIREIFDRYADEIRTTGRVSAALAIEMADATKGVKDYTRTLNNNLKLLGQSTKQAAQDMANGAKGASVFNNSIEAAGNVAGTVASQFGVLGKGIGLVINALTFFVTAATNQSDKLFSTFQDLSRSGSIGSKAMTDVFQSMKGFGYTIDELDKMTVTLSESSRDFALFSGTAATGVKRLETMVEGFRDVRVNLQALGLSTDEQVRAAAGYYRQMGRLGRATDATSAGAIAYIKEMETLTRLTGLQRKEIEDQRQAAEDIDQFYAGLMEMDPAAAQNAYAVFTRLMAMDPSGKKARAFAVSMDGIISGSEDQMQSLFSTSFRLLEFAQAIKQGTMTADQYMQAEAEARKQNIDLQKELAKIGVTDLFGSLKNNVIQVNKGLDPFTNQTARATDEVESLWKATDAATRAQAQTRVNQIDLSNNIQSFINLGVAPATRALAFLTSVVENLTSMLPGGGPENKGYGRKGTGSAMGAAVSTLGHAAGSAVAGTMAAGPVGGIIAGIAGGISGYSSYQRHGGTDVITGKSLGNLDSSFKDKFLQAANEYYQLTGKKVNVTSAFRSSEKQAELYADYVAGRSPFPAAPPGGSKHEAGRAVDVELGIAEDMDRRGLLKKYGLSRPVANDPIHIEGFAGFRGSLSGPMSGYSPNIRMHGKEELSIRPMGSTVNSSSAASEGTMIKLIERVDDLIYLSRSQLSVNEKMLKYAQ